ncbi:MAG: hypothetical protein LBT14_13025 [Treponema sp.]|jgi:hypothetical protein|nr:hypothetical protein [Treponema sp.]
MTLLLKILIYGMVMGMVWFVQKRLFCLILMAYTALSVLGTFSFAAVEPYHSVKLGFENKAQDKTFASLENFFLQQPAEEPTIITKSGSTRFSPLRIGFQRLTALLGSLINEKPYSKSSHITGTKTQYSDLKNTILLKLRI